MELKHYFEKITETIKKYRYAVLILILGLVLMIFPTNKSDTKTAAHAEQSLPVTEQSLEDRLAQVLCEISGAGNVRVVLSIASGEEVIYQSNTNNAHTENSEDTKSDTVLITDANRNQSGLIQQTNPVSYKGALIVCQGADNPEVHLMIVDAVSKLTGLGANRISVVKMN